MGFRIFLSCLAGALSLFLAVDTTSTIQETIYALFAAAAFGVALGLGLAYPEVKKNEALWRMYWRQRGKYHRLFFQFRLAYDELVKTIVELTGYAPTWVEENPVSVLRETFHWHTRHIKILRNINEWQAQEITNLRAANAALTSQLRESVDAQLQFVALEERTAQDHAAEVEALKADLRRRQVQFDELAAHTLANQQAKIDARKGI